MRASWALFMLVMLLFRAPSSTKPEHHSPAHAGYVALVVIYGFSYSSLKK